jgi:hypothetical protein
MVELSKSISFISICRNIIRYIAAEKCDCHCAMFSSVMGI